MKRHKQSEHPRRHYAHGDINEVNPREALDRVMDLWILVTEFPRTADDRARAERTRRTPRGSYRPADAPNVLL